MQNQLTIGQEALAIAFDNLLTSAAISLRQQGVPYSDGVKSALITGIRQFLYNLDDEMPETRLSINGELINDQSFASHEHIADWLNENSKVSEMIAALDSN